MRGEPADRALRALMAEVAEAGFRVTDDFPMDLPQDDASYETYIPLLAKRLPEIETMRDKEMLVRQFIDVRARPFNGLLLSEYAKARPSRESEGFLIATGAAIKQTAVRKNMGQIADLMSRAEYGFARIDLPAALGVWKSDEVDDLLVALLSDPQIGFEAAKALARRRVVRALPALREVTIRRSRDPQHVYFSRAIERLERLEG